MKNDNQSNLLASFVTCEDKDYYFEE